VQISPTYISPPSSYTLSPHVPICNGQFLNASLGGRHLLCSISIPIVSTTAAWLKFQNGHHHPPTRLSPVGFNLQPPLLYWIFFLTAFNGCLKISLTSLSPSLFLPARWSAFLSSPSSMADAPFSSYARPLLSPWRSSLLPHLWPSSDSISHARPEAPIVAPSCSLVQVPARRPSSFCSLAGVGFKLAHGRSFSASAWSPPHLLGSARPACPELSPARPASNLSPMAPCSVCCSSRAWNLCRRSAPPYADVVPSSSHRLDLAVQVIMLSLSVCLLWYGRGTSSMPRASDCWAASCSALVSLI
jgi:hypothetical protein